MRVLILLSVLIFSSGFAHADLKLLALCESFNGNSYVGVWVRGEEYTVDYTDDLDFGDTAVQVTSEAIKIDTLLTWEPIVIPAGKNVVDIAGTAFNCDY